MKVVGPVHHRGHGKSSIQRSISSRGFLHAVQCIETGRTNTDDDDNNLLLKTCPNGRLVRRRGGLMSTRPRGATTRSRRRPDSSRSHALTCRASICHAYESDRKPELLRQLVGAASATPRGHVP
jgi:hypothetical protein